MKKILIDVSCTFLVLKRQKNVEYSRARMSYILWIGATEL